MPHEIALLNDCLIVGAMLFGLGMIGFLSRRNVIVMFLSAEIMLQGVLLSLVAWGRFHDDFGGQTLSLFIVAVAACEAALALALTLTLFDRRRRLDIADWRLLGETGRPAFPVEPATTESLDESQYEEPLPHLAPAGRQPEISREETDYRPQV